MSENGWMNISQMDFSELWAEYEEEMTAAQRQDKKEKKCECGAWKVYGKSCSSFHHALYCDLRGDVDERK